MFYKMIENARNRWLSSNTCTIGSLIDYIERTGMMRDAQVEAIKTYLFLKIACSNKPLAELFIQGTFNSLDLNEIELSTSSRAFLEGHPDAAAALEYACLTNDAGEQVSKSLEDVLKKEPSSVDCEAFFYKAFYDVTYTDYLFSLPMGAGKTYLMAAFIYLDLYFARQEPQNKAFAHNFIIFAPSGLKSSVVPSLKTIQMFDPSWVLAEPAASEIKKSIMFEVLDQAKAEKKSNKTKNPNVQKLAIHQPFSELMGLVAVTNAEKVILDRVELKEDQISIFEDSDDEKDRQANELRNLIGKIPNLSVFIDEVHHAASAGDKKSERKLRAVVNKWTQGSTINSVIGFSGTPYIEKAEKIEAKNGLGIALSEISNIVYYYPLVNGIGNFLKRPVVKISETADSSTIIEKGVRDFLDIYKDTVYEGDLTAKLGIYCGTIEKLETQVYPIVAGVLAEYGLNSNQILKFHKGDSKGHFPQPADSQMEFDILDTPLSKKRVVLLVQIGKEGWDCRSLTGIILSQEGDCPNNMVLQTSCRCLRQVKRGEPETAIIHLNASNGEKLEAQLNKEQHISIKEFMSGNSQLTRLKRYNRMLHLKLPKMDFYQLKVNYVSGVIQKADPKKGIIKALENAETTADITKITDFTFRNVIPDLDDREKGAVLTTFNSWLYSIVKESFGTISMSLLKEYDSELHTVFNKITYKTENNQTVFSSKYNISTVNASIRKSFADILDYQTTEELIPEESSLLNIKNFSTDISTKNPEKYYPSESTVQNIIKADAGKLKITPKMKKTIKFLEENGQPAAAASLRLQFESEPNKDRSYHYLPYRTDSGFEITFLKEMLLSTDIASKDLEVYYNGDRAMTEFKIKCYKKSGDRWNYIGIYTPDFLIIQRNGKKINKAVIVEAKGSIYANDPTFKDKKSFMESDFVRVNNDAFGYKRFDYLYLEDSLPENERIMKTHNKIKEFFGGEN